MIEAESQPNLSLIMLLKRMSPFLKGHAIAFAIGVVLVATTTWLEVITPLWIGKIVDQAIGLNKEGLIRGCQIYLLIIVVKAVLDVVLAYVIQSTGQKVMHTLRGQVFSHILRLGIPYFDRNPTGRLLTRVMNDIKSLGELFTASLSVLILDVLVIIATVIAMLYLDFKLGGLILITFPGVVWVVTHFGQKLNEGYRRVRLHLSHINAFLGENIAAIATIQRLAAESEREKRFNSIVDKHNDAQTQSLIVYARVQPYANVLNGVAMATLIILGGYWVTQGRITLGVVVAFLGYIRNLFQPVRDLVEKYNNYLSARVSTERIGAILDEAVEDTQSGGVSDEVYKEAIIFNQVMFRYPSRDANSLLDVSFQVARGKSLAVVGPTGSGKSTLVRLLLRFYEPTGGSIIFQGRNLSDWNRKELRRRIGVIHQEVYLMEGTLRENLSLGHDFSNEVLINCLKRCQLWEFASNRGGLDMPIYEGGTNLSIGERQLVSFARVMVFNPPTLVLDEATASLDRALEYRLMNAVNEIIQGRTSIVIAHRLSTIQTCHNVLVLEQGRVLQRGQFDELAQSEGLFRDFLTLQGREGALL